MAETVPTGVFYELWDYQSGNLLWTYPSRAEAFGAVRDAIDLHGQDYVRQWAVGRGDEGGDDEPVIDGELLIQTVLAVQTRS